MVGDRQEQSAKRSKPKEGRERASGREETIISRHIITQSLSSPSFESSFLKMAILRDLKSAYSPVALS